MSLFTLKFEIFRLYFFEANCDVTFLRNAETATLEKNQKKIRTTIVAVETTTKKQRQIELEIVRNCSKIVTIVPLQSLQSNSHEPGRVLG